MTNQSANIEPVSVSASERVLAAVGGIIENAVAESNANVNGNAVADPAPSHQEIALRRLVELMGQVSDGAVADLRQLRDDVDATIRAIQARHQMLTTDFAHHVACVEESLRFREVASRHLDRVRSRFAIPVQAPITP